MRYQPLLALVDGYLPNIDRADKLAKLHDLHARYAIALRTYNPETGEIYFHVNMFVALFTMLAGTFTYDRFVMLEGKKVLHSFNTFADAVPQIKSLAAAENSYYSRFHFYQAETLYCAVATEIYMSAGGPWPYHDTYNFAIFMKQVPAVLTDRLVTTCAAAGFKIPDVLQGNARSSFSILARLRRLT